MQNITVREIIINTINNIELMFWGFWSLGVDLFIPLFQHFNKKRGSIKVLTNHLTLYKAFSDCFFKYVTTVILPQRVNLLLHKLFRV
ncbi:MAG: hypothetical protein A3F91_12175 [Flavobacteria bacterium RIFCSPLOWO2_12_FULL_35_11]|nr:MAG: hypothetical protein A3F91_12175 [Flavobacteria bacterium RIFCSPLOWO2_12_FULL_35_11]